MGELTRYLGVGLINAAVGLSVIYAALYAGAPVLAANVMGYGVGLAVSFWLNRRWTFKVQAQQWRGQMLAFVLAFAAAYAANLAAVMLALKVVDAYSAQLAGMAAYTALFYLLSKRCVFGQGRR